MAAYKAAILALIQAMGNVIIAEGLQLHDRYWSGKYRNEKGGQRKYNIDKCWLVAYIMNILEYENAVI